jgi:hypothetical protein
MIFKKVTKSTLWSQLGVLLTLLTFVMGGYDFVFFIPQTFALYLFLLVMQEEKLSVVQRILVSIMLFSTHFIIGTVFVGYLWFKALIVDKVKKRKESTLLLLFLLLSVCFFFLANVAGFSIEKLIQQDTIEIIGSLTNTYSPNNLYVYLQNLGAGWFLVAIAYIATLLQKRREKYLLSFFTFISFGAIFYFLAPTYANKFAIGLSFFATLVVIRYLQSLGFKPLIKSLLFAVLIPIWGLNFYVQYNRYLTFYTQENGDVSAVVRQDKAIIEYIENNDLTDTFIVSDPYTQIIIASLGNVDTANAQYMQLETRENLLEYLENPNSETYEKLLTSPGIPGGTEVHILYTSRLERSIELNDYAWLYNIYSLPIDNSYPITVLDEDLLEDQRRLEKQLIYISDNFILFK